MTLEKQLVDLPMQAGVDQQNEERLTLRFTDVLNLRYEKGLGLRKRRGTFEVGPSNTRFAPSGGPSVMPQPSLVTMHGDEIVRVGENAVHVFDAVTGSANWIYRGKASGISAEIEEIASNLTKGGNGQVALAQSGSIVHWVYVTSSSSGSATGLFTTVIDGVTGARIYSAVPLVFNGNPLNVHLVPWGSQVLAIYYHAPSTSIRCNTYSCVTGQWNTTPTTLGTAFVPSASTLHLDADAYYNGSGQLELAIVVSNAATNEVMAYFYDAALAFVSNQSVGLPATAATCVGIYHRSGDSIIWAAYGEVAGGVRRLYVTGFNATTYAAVFAGVDIDGSVIAGASIAAKGVSFVATSSTQALAVWWASADPLVARPITLKYQVINSAGALQFLAPRQLIRAMPIAKPIEVLGNNNRYLVPIAYGESVMVAELDITGISSTQHPAYIAGCILPRQTLDLTAFPPGQTGVYPSTVAYYNDEWRFVASRIASKLFTADTTYEPISVSLFSESSQQTPNTRPSAQEVNEELLLAHGAMLAEDGQTVAEVGFAMTPRTDEIVLTPSVGGGSLTPTGVYQYVFVYEVIDGAGNIARSIPSTPKTVTMGAADNTVTITVPALNFTNRTTTAQSVNCVIYRTVAGGTLFYAKGSVSNAPTSISLTHVDNASDAAISINQTLYTTGDVLSNVMPSGARDVAYWKNCVVLGNTPDDLVWLSKPTVAGEAPAFTDEGTLEPFQGGRVTAVATLDDKLILFKEGSIWAIVGTPPDDLGNSNLSEPQGVSSDIGCNNPHSIVTVPEGLMFQATNGRVYMLTRAMQVVSVGDDVQADCFRSNGNVRRISSAVSVPTLNMARFSFSSTSGTTCNVLEYDTLHGNSQQPVWMRHGYTVPGIPDNLTTPVSMVLSGGVWHYLANSGKLYREDFTSWLDYNISDSSYIESFVKFAWVKPNTVQGYARTWHALVLGQVHTPSVLNVTLWSDYKTTGSQTSVFTYAAAQAVMQNDTHLNFQNQKAESFQFELRDKAPADPADYGTGQGISFQGLTLEVGVKRGRYKNIPATQKA